MAEVKAPVRKVRPENPFRRKIYDFITYKDMFDNYFITVMIALNTITMCMDYYGASKEYL